MNPNKDTIKSTGNRDSRERSFSVFLWLAFMIFGSIFLMITLGDLFAIDGYVTKPFSFSSLIEPYFIIFGIIQLVITIMIFQDIKYVRSETAGGKNNAIKVAGNFLSSLLLFLFIGFLLWRYLISIF